MDGVAVTRVGVGAARHHIARRLGVDDFGAIDGRQADDARQIDRETQRQQREQRQARAAREGGNRAVNRWPCVHASGPRCLDTHRQLR